MASGSGTTEVPCAESGPDGPPGEATITTTRVRQRVLFLAPYLGDGGINVHQVLGVVPDATGVSAMPRIRDGW